MAFKFSNSKADKKPPRRGSKTTRFNAAKYGIFSAQDVLPWENAEEFDELHRDLVEDFRPVGRTERDRVKDLARIELDRNRIRLAKQAAIRDGLDLALTIQAWQANSIVYLLERDFNGEEDSVDLNYLRIMSPAAMDPEWEALNRVVVSVARTITGLKKAAKTSPDDHDEAIRAAIAMLPADFAEEIETAISDETIMPRGCLAAQINDFIETRFLPRIIRAYYGQDRISSQVAGTAMFSEQFEKMIMLEARLDRRYEKTLAILLRLQELRKG